MKKELGKISHVSFGHGGYQDAMLCLSLTFEGQGWGTSWSIGSGWSLSVKHSQYCKWSEVDRSEQFANMCREIDKLLIAARVDSVDRLKGIPVECTFEDNCLKEFRILTEVL